jgi:hypothetical protein
LTLLAATFKVAAVSRSMKSVCAKGYWSEMRLEVLFFFSSYLTNWKTVMP